MTSAIDVLVTYDIRTLTPEDDRRLQRVAATCERYGQRVQYSVFECRLSEVGLVRLEAELLRVIEPEVDSVNIYRLSGAGAEYKTSLGRRTLRPLGRPWIL